MNGLRALRNNVDRCQRSAAIGIVTAVTTAFAVIIGCAAGDRPLEAVDPNAAPADPSWNQVFSIIQRECTPCHNDGGTNSEDEDRPKYVTCEDVIGELGDLYEEVFEKNTMPPGAWPRLTSEEKLTIKRWIENGAKAPCTGN
jgi:uncharacterized membrane protein